MAGSESMMQQVGVGSACVDCAERTLAAEVTSPVVLACLARVQALAAEPASARTLMQIERFVRLAREAWAVEQGMDFGSRSPCDPYVSGSLPAVATMGSMLYPNPAGGFLNANGFAQAIPPLGGPMAPAALGAAENFGASAMRELIEAFGAKKPEEIVQAICAAQKAGMMDLARKLERLLGVEPGPGSTEPVTGAKDQRVLVGVRERDDEPFTSMGRDG